MKGKDLDKLKAATKVGSSETTALFSTEFTLFTKYLSKNVICNTMAISRKLLKTTIGTRKSFSLLLNFLIFRLKTDTRDNRGVGQYFFFTGTTLLLKGFLKDSLSHLKNKDTGNTLLAEKILIHDFGNVAVYVTLHDTVNGNGSSQVGNLKEGS